MELLQQVELACRRLLSEQNRDPYALTYGCFDRRHWGWKLIDYPEATFQRLVRPLAWQLTQPGSGEDETQILAEAVRAGLRFATRIQHRDGSFDQAFPHEHSFGATAFLFAPMLEAYRKVSHASPPEFRNALETSLRQACDFMCQHREAHAHIANHLAGAALSLLEGAQFFDEPRYERRALALLEQVLVHQSPEGWFLEYEGADPGYQTLCLYYLARFYRLRPDVTLRAALERAVAFLAWFAHPDGTFGGEYGSRRTAVFYPGGLALLSHEFPMAHSLFHFMRRALSAGRTVTLNDIDIGNLAPLLENTITALDAEVPPLPIDGQALPCQSGLSRDFPEAGLYVRATPRHYVIVGAGNGGVVKVFDRDRRMLLWNDGGYVGLTDEGSYLTTQITDLNRPCTATPDTLVVEAQFYAMVRATPTPVQFVILRLINLTLMRWVELGHLVKQALVRWLISGKRPTRLRLIRSVRIEADRIVLSDVIKLEGRLQLRWLEYGRPFVAIHMASARYFEGAAVTRAWPPIRVNIETLMRQGETRSEVTL